MAAVNRTSMQVACLIFIVASLVGNSCGLVHELMNNNFEKFLRGKLLTLTYLDSPDCEKCRIMFPFFVAASQAFPHDPEIFFTRTSDANLVKKFDVTDLPAIVYKRFGSKSHARMNVDIAVDNVIDEIARILGGNFGGLTRTYHVHLNDRNYDEIIGVPSQAVLLLIHDKNDGKDREVIEKLAYTFRKEDSILFADLDIVTHKNLRDSKFNSREVPAMMWFDSDEKDTAKIFGGVHSHELLTQFVNEKTGINRNEKGELTSKAGLIPEADNVLEKHIINVMEGNYEDMKSVLAEIGDLQEEQGQRNGEMLEYYLYVLENIGAHGAEKSVKAILQDLDDRLTNKEGLTSKQQDVAARKKNIVARFSRLADKYAEDIKTKSREEIQMEIDLVESNKALKKKKEPDHSDHEEL